MATFSLDDLRAAADKKYAPTIIEAGDDKFVLPSILRMDPAARDKVSKLIASVEDWAEDESAEDLNEQLRVFEDLIEIAEENGRGTELVSLIGGDAAILIDLVTEWMKGSQAGEA